MSHNKLIHYMTTPEEETDIDLSKVRDLKNFLKDFDYSMINNQHDFNYKGLEIVITRKGTILISMVVYSDLADNILLLSKLINKINSVASIKYFSEKIHVNDLKGTPRLNGLASNIKIGYKTLGAVSDERDVGDASSI